ncbi:polysaccharide biosynthesis tyrosine autokinase [Candidatus Burkholderia verschuerenii]|nr:polysaccharide biosynthesis tyrosine autokinase [Candidatus Burkholderia verschuerenii]
MNEPEDLYYVQSSEREPDTMNLPSVFDVALDNKRMIAIVAACFVAVGALYSVLHAPVYRGDLVVQLEDSMSPPVTGPLNSQTAVPGGDTKSKTDGEIQLLESRTVLSQAVDNTHLFVDAKPHYFPLIGRWIAAHSDGLSSPGIFGLGGYAWGTESIDVPQFDVPQKMEDDKFYLRVLPGNKYQLDGKDLDKPVEGQVGKTLKFKTDAGEITLFVAKLEGRPGAEFDLKRQSRLVTIQDLQDQIDVKERGKESDIIGASYDGTDPVLVAGVLNEVGRQYLAQNVRRKTEEAQRSIDFLQSQIPLRAESLRRAEDDYNHTRAQLSSVSLGDEASMLLRQSVDADSQLAALRQKRLELSARYGPNHPDIQALNAQIADLGARSTMLNDRIKVRPMIEQDILRKTRDVQVNQQLYMTLQDNLQEMQLVKAGMAGSARIVDWAPIPEKPIWPRMLIVLPLSALAGLFIGFGAALLRSRLFRGVSDSRDIERTVGLDVYATVPNSVMQKRLEKRMDKTPGATTLLAACSPRDPAIESLRSFRAALQHMVGETVNNRVMFTSSRASVGKSFVAANSAALLASPNRRVLLVDADIRNGMIHHRLGLKRQYGFADLLESGDVQRAIQHTSIEYLDFISAGTEGMDADLLLQSPFLEKLLEELSSRYDIVVIDTPPTLEVADSASLAPNCASVFLVTLAGVTKMSELEESVKRLRQVGVTPTGSIFNRVTPTFGKYGYGEYGANRSTPAKGARVTPELR